MNRYSSIKTAAFGSELAMEKVAFGLMEAALGKIMFSNFLGRHGHRLPGAKTIGAEILGMGVRAGLQGKPMISRPTRELIAITVDPKLVSAYEKSYQLGSAMQKYGPRGIRRMSSAIGLAGKIPGLGRIAPGLKEGMSEFKEILDMVPLESKGLRKIVDYSLSSPSRVGSDIVNLFKGPLRTKTASEPWNRPNPKERSTPLTSQQKAKDKAHSASRQRASVPKGTNTSSPKGEPDTDGNSRRSGAWGWFF
jgi:hypothetical protein